VNKEIISNKQGFCISWLFIIGSSSVLGIGGEAKQDVWISFFIALLMSFPMFIIYSKLLMISPGKNLYDILLQVFGSIFGRIISILYIWYSFHLGSVVIRDFSEFVNIVAYPETPQFITVIFLGLTAIWIVKAGIEVIGRFSVFAFTVLLIDLIIELALSLINAQLINMKPVLYNGMKPVLSNAFSIFSFPFAETVIFTMAFHTLKNNKKTLSVLLVSALIGGGLLLIGAVRDILVLGPISSNLYFPSYMAVRTISIGNFLQRFEGTVTLGFILAGFIKISMCNYAACNGIAKIFSVKNYKSIVAPVGLLMMDLACILYGSIMEMVEWTKIYPYYALPFQVILPVIIYIAAKIKFRKLNHTSPT